MPAANVAAAPAPQTTDQPHVTYALSATIPKGSETHQGKTTPTYADSGATDHFFVDRHVFADYKELKNPIEGHAAPRGASFRVIGRGTIKRKYQTTEGTFELVFRNALHAPDLLSNLISINRFDKAGFKVVFGGGYVRFNDSTGKEVLRGTGTGGMYLLSSLGPLDRPAAMTARSLAKPTTLEVWHRRFGHASVKVIREALTKNLVDGLNIKGDLTVAGLCEDCVYGKHAARPYDAIVEPKGSPNNRVHIDLWGPSSVPSLGGAVYMMVAVDGGTSYVSVYFLTRKDAHTTLTAFSSYHVQSERQTGKKL